MNVFKTNGVREHHNVIVRSLQAHRQETPSYSQTALLQVRHGTSSFIQGAKTL